MIYLIFAKRALRLSTKQVKHFFFSMREFHHTYVDFIILFQGKGSIETFWLVGLREGVSSSFDLLSRRPRNHSTLYQRNDSSPPYTQILRDSPNSSRHKRIHHAQSTPNSSTDFSRMTPPLNSNAPSTPPMMMSKSRAEQRRNSTKNYLQSPNAIPMATMSPQRKRDGRNGVVDVILPLTDAEHNTDMSNSETQCLIQSEQQPPIPLSVQYHRRSDSRRSHDSRRSYDSRE